MSSIHIRSVPPEILGALKRLARAHHRSLQGELRSILERAARMAPPEAQERGLGLVTVKVGGTTAWHRAEVYDSDGR